MPSSIYKSLQKTLVCNIMDEKHLSSLYFEELGRVSRKIKRKKTWEYYCAGFNFFKEGKIDRAEKYFKKTIKENSRFFAGYLGIAFIAYVKQDKDKERVYADIAFKKARKKLSSIPPAKLKNHRRKVHYLVALAHKARIEHEKENFSYAEKIYRKILSLDKEDCHGVRFYISGMFIGFSPKEIDLILQKAEKSKDWKKVKKIVKKQNKKYKFL